MGNWNSDAERDLAMAVILSHGAIKHDWAAVNEKMTAWGYDFTTGSMSQHWTKKVLKSFKDRRAADGIPVDPKTPKKSNRVTKPTSKASAGSKRKVKAEIKSDEDKSDEESPSKNRSVIKEDPDVVRARERSATVDEGGFED